MLRVFLSLEVLVFHFRANRVHSSLAAESVRLFPFCLRDDFCDGEIFDGTIRCGGNELAKRSVGMSLENCVNSEKRGDQTASAAKAEMDTSGTKAKHENF